MEDLSIENVVDIDSHLTFIKRILKEYDWGSVRTRDIQQYMQLIEQKQKDPKLYLSVTGEFSTGKSTFINALTREEFLEVNPVQGTTSAITMIAYSDLHEVYVTLRQEGSLHRIKMFSESEDGYTYSSFKEAVRQWTSDQDETKQIEKVEVFLPSRFLQNGIIIIDTPGTNALERWHEEVTKRAISDYTDVSIIVTSALSPLPKSQVNFIHENLESQLKKSVFVVTFIDGLHHDELDRNMLFIGQKAKKEFDLDTPVVLPYAAPYVLNEDTASAYYQISKHTEEQLIKNLKRQRMLLQYEAITETLVVLIESLGKSFDHTLINLSELEKVLMGDTISGHITSSFFDISAFFTKLPLVYRNNFEYPLMTLKNRYRILEEEMMRAFEQKIFPKIFSSVPKIFSVAPPDFIEATLQTQLRKFITYADETYGLQLYETANKLLTDFHVLMSMEKTGLTAYREDGEIVMEDYPLGKGNEPLMRAFFEQVKQLLMSRLYAAYVFYRETIDQQIVKVFFLDIKEHMTTEEILEAYVNLNAQRRKITADYDELKNRLFTSRSRSGLLKQIS